MLFAYLFLKMFDVEFKTINGRSFKIKVDLDNSIDSYQESIAEKSNVLVVDQRLIYAGKQLETCESFKKYGIQEAYLEHHGTKYIKGLDLEK